MPRSANIVLFFCFVASALLATAHAEDGSCEYMHSKLVVCMFCPGWLCAASRLQADRSTLPLRSHRRVHAWCRNGGQLVGSSSVCMFANIRFLWILVHQPNRLTRGWPVAPCAAHEDCISAEYCAVLDRQTSTTGCDVRGGPCSSLLMTYCRFHLCVEIALVAFCFSLPLFTLSVSLFLTVACSVPLSLCLSHSTK
jgi:hypothetical protein